MTCWRHTISYHAEKKNCGHHQWCFGFVIFIIYFSLAAPNVADPTTQDARERGMVLDQDRGCVWTERRWGRNRHLDLTRFFGLPMLHETRRKAVIAIIVLLALSV
jgi:hypothetical protein